MKNYDYLHNEKEQTDEKTKDELDELRQKYIATLLEKEARKEVIDKAMVMYKHLHKVLCGKTVCIIDESTAEKSTLRDYKNVAMCYKSSKDKILFENPTKKNPELIDAFPIWFNNANLCQKVVCDPEKPFGEMIDQDGFRVFNDWEEANVKDGEGTTDLFWQHIKENVCDGREDCFKFFQMWIYDLIANPKHRNGIAIAISGDCGCGKSVISKILSMCFHPKYFATINNSTALLEKFSTFQEKILISCEESNFAGDKRSGVWGVYKDLICNDTTNIERKFIDVQRIENKLHFIINSNDEFIVPKQKTDRRYFVLRCNNNRRCDREYFGELTKQMENGGAYKLIQEAKEHKQEAMDFDYRNIPETEIGAENMLETCPLILRYLISAIDDFNPENEVGEYDPFYYEEGEIWLNSNKLIESYKAKTGDKTFLTSRKVGKMLAEFTGTASIDKRIIDISNKKGEILTDRVIKCFVFSSVDELKRNITQHYFGGLNPFN